MRALARLEDAHCRLASPPRFCGVSVRKQLPGRNALGQNPLTLAHPGRPASLVTTPGPFANCNAAKTASVYSSLEWRAKLRGTCYGRCRLASRLVQLAQERSTVSGGRRETLPFQASASRRRQVPPVLQTQFPALSSSRSLAAGPSLTLPSTLLRCDHLCSAGCAARLSALSTELRMFVTL
jgi:hypothetical protein